MGKRPRSRLRGLILALVFFSISLVIGWVFVLPGWRARLFGVQTQGTVISVDECTSNDSGGDVVLRVIHPLDDIQDNVQPTVRFTDRQGTRYEVEDSICGNYGIGETVNLWYLPDDPTTFSLEADTGTLVPLTLLVSFFMVVALLLVLWFLLRPFLLLAMVALVSRKGTTFNGGFPQMGGNTFNSGFPQMGGGQIVGNDHHRIGEAVLVEGRWQIILTGAYPSQGDERAHPVPGRFYAILPLTLRNVSNEPLSPRQATFRLYDLAGLDYPNVQALKGPMPDLLQPGEAFSFALAYDVPGTLRQFRLSFYPPASFLSQASWLVIF